MNAVPTPPATPPDDPLRWSDALLLGYGPMDQRHQEFVTVVAALQQAPDAELPRHFDALATHLREHFAEEDRWMEESGFPARGCHMDEHAAVLASVAQVGALLERGEPRECRRLAQELVRWFPGHADYLDAALSHWLCKHRLGGKPVILRRDLAPSPGLTG